MRYDFAISYAGEDVAVARRLAHLLQEISDDLTVFLADENIDLLVGIDGEQFFERLFTQARQVIVLISKHYKQKQWTRFEWDIILDREKGNRFIPVRLDDSRLYGLPPNIIYISFNGSNFEEIAAVAIKKLLRYEEQIGHQRQSGYKKILNHIKHDSEGATAQAAQLVYDRRTRTPLGDCKIPKEPFPILYTIINEEILKHSAIKRLSVNIIIPPNLSPGELRFNLKHCAASRFNHHKPDAVMVFAYLEANIKEIGKMPYSAGRVVFAPFGKWEKALDGFAYNIPVDEFRYSVNLAPSYFSAT